MTGYLVPVTCHRCGGELEPVTEGRVIGDREVSAICRCVDCGTEWHLHVSLLPANTGAAHGSTAGYAKHRRHGEEACDECKRAHARSQLEDQHRRRREMVSA